MSAIIAVAAGLGVASTVGARAQPAANDARTVPQIRKDCETQAKAAGTPKPQLRTTVSACVVKQRPDQATRETCRLDGLGQGLKGAELERFADTCTGAKSAQ